MNSDDGTTSMGVEEDQIDEALERLQERETDWADINPKGINLEEEGGCVSRTLGALEHRRRPQAETVSENCPHSVWFSSPTEVKCYCRVMYLITWSTAEPNTLTNCDGQFLGQEE